MNLPEIFQRRLQDYLRRYDKLAKAVGPLKAPQPTEVSREVAGLLILSANQCCVAAAIMDTAENVAITTPSAEPAVRVRLHDQLTHLSRRGKMVVVPGMGKSNFPFPDTDELVLRALMRLSGNDDQTEPGKGKAEKKRLTGTGSSEESAGSAHKGERLTYIIAPMDFDSIMRLPDDGIESTDSVRTPHRDLLFGRSTQPQVCFLRDAEKLVEQIPTRDGMYVLEFEVGPEDFLPDVLLDRAGEFLDRAEQFLSWAEALWPDTQPPMSAVALPPEEKRFLSAGAA
jgi:hypothetical protein